MANVYQSGSVYADSVGQLVTGRCRVSHIIFYGASAGNAATVRDGTSGSDAIKATITASGTHSTIHLDLSGDPMLFNEGIYLSAISASCHVTLILTRDRSS